MPNQTLLVFKHIKTGGEHEAQDKPRKHTHNHRKTAQEVNMKHQTNQENTHTTMEKQIPE